MDGQASRQEKVARVLAWAANPPLWACLLPAAALLYFLDKALHIDDPQFLTYARIIGAHPWNPFHQTFFIEGADHTLFELPNPLLPQYVLALGRALLGESEPALHLVTFLFAPLALWGMAILAKEMDEPPLLLCTLYAFSSAFLVMGASISPDLPAAAFGVLSLALLFRGMRTDSTRDLVAAGLLAGACCLSRYTGLIVLGLLPAYPFLRGQFRMRWWIPAAVAFGVLGGWELVTWALAGKPHLWTALHAWKPEKSEHAFWAFVYAEVLHLGAQVPALLALAVALIPRKGWLLLLSAVVLTASTLAYFAVPPTHTGLDFAFAVPGFLTLGLALAVAGEHLVTWIRQRGLDHAGAVRVLLVVWLLALTFATVRYIHVSAKYFLLPLPAALVLLVDGLRGLQGVRRRMAWGLAAAAIPLTIATGLGVAVSDYRWANLYRDYFDSAFASTIPKEHGTVYVLAEWGLRYYAEKHGAVPLTSHTPWKADDLVLYGDVAFVPVVRIPRLVSVNRVIAEYPGPFALADWKASAGFYSNAWGRFPYAPVSESGEMIHIDRADLRHGWDPNAPFTPVLGGMPVQGSH